MNLRRFKTICANRPSISFEIGIANKNLRTLVNMRIKYLFSILFALSIQPLRAIETYEVPQLQENDSRENVIVKKLNDETLVQHYFFSAVIPKGWSINPVGPSKLMRASLTATPMQDVEGSSTYFGIHSLSAKPVLDLDARLKKLKKEKPEWKLSFATWNKVKWLVAEHLNTANGLKAKTWAAFSIVDNHEYIMTVATPATQSKKFEASLREMMKSVKIKTN